MDNFTKRKYVSPELVLDLLEKECVLRVSTDFDGEAENLFL